MSTARLFQLGVAAAAASLVISGCGSSSVDSTTTSTAGSAEDSAACVQAAEAIVADARKPLKPKALTPFEMSKNSGRSIWLVSAGQTEFTQSVASGFEAAAKKAGMSSRYVQASGQVNQMQALVDQAVAAKAAGIALLNIQPETVAGPLEEATKDGITVIDLNNGDPKADLQPGIFAHVAAEFSEDGKKTAAWMLADSGCDVRLATFTDPTLAVVDLMVNGAIDEIKDLCSSACTVTENKFSYSSFSTKLAPLADTVIRRDPKINYIYPGADAFAGVISPVLEQAGVKVTLAGHDANSSNLKAMAADNTLQKVTVGNGPAEYVGWALVDQLGRGMAGSEPADWALPGQVIDTTNVGDGSYAQIYPEFDGFEAGFATAWGM